MELFSTDKYIPDSEVQLLYKRYKIYFKMLENPLALQYLKTNIAKFSFDILQITIQYEFFGQTFLLVQLVCFFVCFIPHTAALSTALIFLIADM